MRQSVSSFIGTWYTTKFPMMPFLQPKDQYEIPRLGGIMSSIQRTNQLAKEIPMPSFRPFLVLCDSVDPPPRLVPRHCESINRSLKFQRLIFYPVELFRHRAEKGLFNQHIPKSNAVLADFERCCVHDLQVQRTLARGGTKH